METVFHFHPAVLVLLLGAPAGFATAPLFAQETPSQASAAKDSKTTTDAAGDDVYYYFTMGHLEEQQYEVSNNADAASASIDLYKKALELRPNSPVIMERLAEIYKP